MSTNSYNRPKYFATLVINSLIKLFGLSKTLTLTPLHLKDINLVYNVATLVLLLSLWF